MPAEGSGGVRVERKVPPVQFFCPERYTEIRHTFVPMSVRAMVSYVLSVYVPAAYTYSQVCSLPQGLISGKFLQTLNTLSTCFQCKFFSPYAT